jgi:hypothetical protein
MVPYAYSIVLLHVVPFIHVTGGEQPSSSALSYCNQICLPAVQLHPRLKTATRVNSLHDQAETKRIRIMLI